MKHFKKSLCCGLSALSILSAGVCTSSLSCFLSQNVNASANTGKHEHIGFDDAVFVHKMIDVGMENLLTDGTFIYNMRGSIIDLHPNADIKNTLVLPIKYCFADKSEKMVVRYLSNILQPAIEKLQKLPISNIIFSDGSKQSKKLSICGNVLYTDFEGKKELLYYPTEKKDIEYRLPGDTISASPYAFAKNHKFLKLLDLSLIPNDLLYHFVDCLDNDSVENMAFVNYDKDKTAFNSTTLNGRYTVNIHDADGTFIMSQSVHQCHNSENTSIDLTYYIPDNHKIFAQNGYEPYHLEKIAPNYSEARFELFSLFTEKNPTLIILPDTDIPISHEIKVACE